MRKVKLWIGMSFDGFTADANEKLDWLVPHATSPDGFRIFKELRLETDTILVGRVNYEGFFQYWPKIQQDSKAPAHDVAARLRDLPPPERGRLGPPGKERLPHQIGRAHV